MADTKEEKNPTQPPNRPFEGMLRYVATDGRWVAGAPAHDITADEWEAGGYSNRGNFTPEDLVATGLYVLEPPGKSATNKQNKTETGATANDSTGQTGTETKDETTNQ